MTDKSKDLEIKERELIVLHQKERKELTAKIKVLKKSMFRSDKKKKKEIMDEIVRLKSDLNEKQNEELARLKINVTVDENSETMSEKNNQESKPIRVSRAQTRRGEKKNVEEKECGKELKERIVQPKRFKVHGKKNIEMHTIRNILLQRNLMVFEIPSDGHCLYNAIAHQLELIGDTPVDFYDLRKKTAIYLKENIDRFLPFIDNPNTNELLTIEQYEKYCDDVAETSTWGGAVELQVLSCILKCPIEVIQAEGVPYIIGNEYESTRKLTLTYHRHMYRAGAHYNSVTKYEPNTEDS